VSIVRALFQASKANVDLLVLASVNTIGFCIAVAMLKFGNINDLFQTYGVVVYFLSGLFESIVGAQTYLPGSLVLVVGPSIEESLIRAITRVWLFSSVGVFVGLFISFKIGQGGNFAKFSVLGFDLNKRSTAKLYFLLPLAFMPNTAALLTCWLGLKGERISVFFLVFVVSIIFNFLWTILFFYSGSYFEELVLSGGPVLIIAIWVFAVMSIFKHFIQSL